MELLDESSLKGCSTIFFKGKENKSNTIENDYNLGIDNDNSSCLKNVSWLIT
jgi:hypothetical protein